MGLRCFLVTSLLLLLAIHSFIKYLVSLNKMLKKRVLYSIFFVIYVIVIFLYRELTPFYYHQHLFIFLTLYADDIILLQNVWSVSRQTSLLFGHLTAVVIRRKRKGGNKKLMAGLIICWFTFASLSMMPVTCYVCTLHTWNWSPNFVSPLPFDDSPPLLSPLTLFVKYFISSHVFFSSLFIFLLIICSSYKK